MKRRSRIDGANVALVAMQNQIARIVEGMGICLDPVTGRADAGETAAFARQLEQIKTKTYDRRYPGLMARALIPLDTEVDPRVETFTWRSWDQAGMASIITDGADDLPNVDVMAAEKTQRVYALGASYRYTIFEMQSASFSGVPLDSKRAMATRRAIENKIEVLAAFGDSTVGLPGFLNNANIPIISAPGSLYGNWDTETAAHILEDLNAIAASIVITTKRTHSPNTMVLPVNRYQRLATLPMSAIDNRSVLRVFLENSPTITNIDQWGLLDLADTSGTGPRVLCYERSDEILQLVIPLDFMQLPPQPINLTFRVPCVSKFGGVTVYYPLGLTYAEGV